MTNIFDRERASNQNSHRQRIEDIARQSQVPVNVLIALGEVAGVESPDDLVSLAGSAAQEMGPRIQAGEDIRDLIRQAAGDQSDAFLTRVREIGDELYPDQMNAQREQQEVQRRETEPGFGGNVGRSFLAGVSEGVGSAVEGIGALADQPFALARQDEHYQPGLLARMGRSGGDYLRDRANDLRQGMSEGARSAVEASTPGGDLTKPSTWTLGEGASLYGYSLLAADVLGSFLPVVAASVLARRPIVGVGVGASQSAGAGAGEARGIIDEAFNERDENGERLLERESPYFRELLASGMDEEEALETTQNAAARVAALFNAPVGGFGGAATGAIIRGTLPRGIGTTGGPMRRALTRGALSASEEGFQEALEGVATRFGVQTATGMDMDLSEDTFGDFILGALGGGVVGGVSGAIPQRAPEDEGDDPLLGSPDPVPPSPLALPAPTDGGTIFQGGESPAPDGGGPRMVQVQLAGEPSAWGAEIVGGTANTVTLQGEDGAIFDIPRADIESGAVQITSVEAPAARPATEAPAAIEPDADLMPRAAEPEPASAEASDPFEDARNRLQMVEDQARARGWDKKLIEMRDQLRGIIDAAGRAEQKATNEASQIVTKKDGTPFKDQASATRALGRLGFSMDTHDIVARDGGFVAEPRAEQQEAEDAAILDEREAGGEGIGGRRAVDPQTGEGSPQADQDAAADPMGSPDGADIPGNLAGSSGTGEPVSSLIEAPAVVQQNAQQQIPNASPPMDVDRAKARRSDVNAFLDAAESGERSWNGEIDGRMVVVRGNRARVRVNDDRSQDIITDTEGMGREDLATWVDFATAQAQRAAPGAAPRGAEPASTTADPLGATLGAAMARPPETHTTKKGKMLEGYVLRAGTTEGQAKKIDPYAFPKAGGWFVRRARADEFNGLDDGLVVEQQNEHQDTPDARRETAQRAAMADRERVAPDGHPSIASTPEGDAIFARNRAALGKFKKGQRVQWVNDNFNPPRTFTGTIAKLDRRSGQGIVDVVKDGGVDGRGSDVFIGASQLTLVPDGAAQTDDAPAPTREAFDAAAAETAPEPTPAQAEAENYKTGKIDWRGVTLSIENAKGSVRRKVGADGKTAWEVTMPADYGRILRTKGADGDHVDFYMGPEPASDRVFVVDQKDAETGAFDEHKVMLGFVNQQQARQAFLKAFSDGKGAARWGAVTPMSVADFQTALKDDAAWTKPMKMAQETTKPAAKDRGQTTLPGYERLMDGAEPTTTQTRMTDDGFLVKREVNGTTVIDPKGRVIFGGTHDVAEAKINEVIETAREPENAARREKPVRPPVAPSGPRVMVNEVGRDGPTDAERKAGKAPYDADPDMSAFDAVGMVPGKGAAWDHFRIQATPSGNGTHSYKVRAIKKRDDEGYEFIASRDMRPDPAARITPPPTKQIGRFPTAEAAIEALKAEGMRTGKPEEPAETAPLDPQPRGPRRIDWWWTNNADRRGEALKAAGVDGVFAGQRGPMLSEVQAKLDGEQFEALRNAIFGPEQAELVKSSKETDKAKAIRLFKEAVQRGDQAEVAKMRPLLSKMLGGPATAMLEAEARPASKDDQKVQAAETAKETTDQATPDTPADQEKPAFKKMKGLSEAENAELSALEAELARRIKSQTNSGLDPEMVGMAFKIGSLYVRAGRRRFRQLIDAMIDRMGLTLEQAQPYARNAYNQIRDDMELAGEDVADMDTSQEVVAEVRKMRAEQVKTADTAPTSEQSQQTEAQDDGNRAGNDRNAVDESGQSQAVPRDVGEGSGLASDQGDLQSGEGGLRPDPVADDSGLENARGDGGRAGQDRSGGTRFGSRPRNYRIAPGALNDTRGEKTRAKDSIEAIRLLKQIESQNRRATPEEQAKLALYAGAGSLNPAVPNSDGSVRSGWNDLSTDLQSLVSEAEMQTIARTTQYAFYTSEEVVRGMWSAAERLGFKGGTVFEPGMGIGHFLGMAPEGIAGRVTYRGIELDSITARIARQLYPEATVQNQDYTTAAVPQGFYDLAIGNPPFANIEIKSDRKYPQKFLLHDYFFAKTLDAVRPGGLLAFVTSEGTMNKMDDSARRYLAERGDLVGAIRLPNTAFKGSAGTEVTTDVIFLRKRMEGEPAGDQSWLNVEMVPLPGLDGARTTEFKVNRYFIDNPDMILGKQGGFGTQRFRGQYAVVPNEGENIGEAFAAAVKRLPADVITEANYDPTKVQEEVDPDSGQTKAGSYYVRDGALWQYDGSVGRKVKRRGAEGGTMTADDYRKAAQFVGVRDALRAVYTADLSDNQTDARKHRKALNEAYDAFVAEHGPINRSKTQNRRPNAPALERARANQREEALEEGREWDEGSFDPTPYIDATMLDDGQGDDGDAPAGPVAGATQKKGKRYSWTQIAKMRKEARERLGDTYREGSFDPGAVPDTEIVKRVNLNALMDDPEVWRIAALEKYDPETDTAEKGPVFTTSVVARQTEPEIRDAKDALNYSMATRGYPDIAMIAEKAGITEAAALVQLDGLVFRDPETGRYENRDLYLSGNVRRKLEAAKQISGPEMDANIRALEEVMPRDLTEYEVTATPGMPWIPLNVMQDFAKELGVPVKVDRASAGGRWIVEGDKRSTEATVSWGTQDVPFPDLLERVLNRTVIKVTRTHKHSDGTTTTTLDETATQAANEKAEAIRERFAGWVWQDEGRKETLLRIYNDRFNSTVAPSFDGSYLTTPGIAKGWQWRPHQMRAIARILQSGSTYLAHAVGAGKTSEMIAAAMEARRLGIARKPMFTVPNHMLGQFATEFYEHYPTANIIVADDRRFHTDRRRQFIADAAANDYDAIILTHSSFQKIPVSDTLNDEFVQAEIERFDEAIRASKADGDRITTKEMERAKEKLEQRLRGARDASRADAQLTFEEMGIDMMFVDEAHLFRKLDFATQLGAIKGVTPSGSQMAWDLFLKTRHLERINPGRGIILASGTPITNTMAEVFTISRYIQHDTLEAQGMLDFDSWAQSYGETAIDYEPDAAGNYKAVSRFSKFVNTRDLSLMVRERMDTVIPEDLEKYVVRPKLAGGGRTAIAVPRSDAVEAYQGELAARMKAIENRKGPPKKGDDNHLVVIGDGIAAATDMRLIDPNASGRDSKLTRLAENVLKVWKESAKTPFHKPDGATHSYSEKPAFTGPAAQMVFADIQRRPGKSPFDTHEFIRDYLIRNGVPNDQIALFRDFKNTEAKRRLFRRVNDGEVRVIVGSAKAMGTGVNAQKRLIAMHNLDPHWFPALDEQRVGRILRQGNWNPEIQVYDYATEGTYDSTMWQMMGRKARTIEDFLRGDPNINEMEDVGPASVFEQLAGMTTPDPRILQLKELQETVKKLGRRRANTASEKRALVSSVRNAERSAGYYAQEAAAWEAVAGKHIDLRGDNFLVTVDGQEITERKAFGEAMEAAALAWANDGKGWPTVQVGEVNGVPVLLERADSSGRYFDASFMLPADGMPEGIKAAFNLRFSEDAERLFPLYENPVDTAKAITRAMNDVPAMIEHSRRGEAAQKAKAAKDQKALEKFEGFKDQALLAESEAKLKELTATLDAEETARRAAPKPPAEGTSDATDAGRESRFMAEPVPAEGLRDIAADITREIKASGLAGKVGVRLVRGLMDAAGVPIQGRQRGAQIDVNPDSGDGALGTLRHEIIHALRDAGLWGTPYGLFTRPEWQGLVRAARADTALLKKVEAAYPDLDSRAQLEEAIAEKYRRWAQNMDQRSGVDRAFGKIKAFIEAIANALRGKGFQSAARTFDMIATGQIGGRGPDSPDGQGGRMAESRDPRESLREWQREGRRNTDGFTDVSTRPEAAMLFTALERAKTPRAAELAADKWVRAMGRETGVEYLVAFDRMGGLISVGRGEQRSVGMSDQLAAALADGAAHYVTHNHPSNGGFSIQDLANVAMFDVDISAIGHREAVVSGRIGPAVEDTDVSRSPEGMGRFIAMVDGVVIKHLGEMLRRNEVTVEALNSAHSHIFDMVRHRHGIIDLRSNGSKIVARLGIDAEALMEATDERIRHVLQANHVRVLPFRDQIGDPPLGGAFDTGDRGSGAIILPAPGRERAERSGASLPAAAEGGLNEGQPRSPDGRFAGHAAKYSRQMLADDGPVTARKERGIIGQMITDAMGGKSSTYNILALVPSEPLFQELGKNLMAAGVYLRHKHALGAMRNERQAAAASLMDEWRGFLTRNRKQNEAMMSLMHDATIAGIDPARPFTVRPRKEYEGEARYLDYVEAKRSAFNELRARWNRLPKKAQSIYQKVRDAYREASDTERQIIMDNVKSAMELNLKRARLRYEDDLRKIEEDGLEGDERTVAEAEAADRLAAIKKRDGYGRNARLASLRAMFEQNEVDAPYFPLLRHGSYYVTVKDENNKVVSFSKFESERAQIQEAARLRRANPGHTVKTGLLDSSGGRGPDVDPNFVADVENMIGQTVADPALMDAIWQRYLETLPDFSIRKSRLHRKGTPGYSQDAFRGYARQMFHSAHQLARLKYGMHMQQALDDAKREADAAEDPNRAMAVVNEMEKRHEWVMNPKVSAWSTWATGAAFVYYLGATPAAALVNISQTVVVGIPVLAAGFERGTIGSASRHLGRALREFGMGKGFVSNAKSLKPDEKAAIEEAYRRGIIDKSQAHDLAGVAETGVEYSDIRARMMRPIAFLFHHAERLNREITFMAAYRMAKEAGMEGDAAIEKAGNLTWKSHFNYESDSRPRLQHNDFVRVATVFRNYQLNMLYRLFRDLHQSLKAKSEPERKEARAQLIGITGMMMMMAGVSGTWGYALITTLAGLFMPGGADDIEQEVKEALVNTLGRDMAGIILKGVPGHLSGINLSSRMGMPELWFRRPDRQQEGDDLYQYWAEQMLGAVPGMAQNAFRGINMALEGEVWRGVETASPKFVRDWMRSARYAQEGVTTYRGNPIVESVSPQEALTQALGFSPARISEQYQTNRWMWNTQGRITDRRGTILRRVGDDIRAGNPISDRSSRAIREFNSEFPQYAITTDTIRQSIRARARGERETVGGVRLNRRLDGTIRGETAPGIYSN